MPNTTNMDVRQLYETGNKKFFAALKSDVRNSHVAELNSLAQ